VQIKPEIGEASNTLTDTAFSDSSHPSSYTLEPLIAAKQPGGDGIGCPDTPCWHDPRKAVGAFLDTLKLLTGASYQGPLQSSVSRRLNPQYPPMVRRLLNCADQQLFGPISTQPSPTF
jgi:hypothetical protein